MTTRRTFLQMLAAAAAAFVAEPLLPAPKVDEFAGFRFLEDPFPIRGYLENGRFVVIQTFIEKKGEARVNMAWVNAPMQADCALNDAGDVKVRLKELKS